MAEEQTVADTDVQDAPVTEEGSAQGDDLDSLLNEWESRSKAEEPKEEPKPKGEQKESTPDEIKQVAAWVKEQQQRQIEEQTQKDIESAVSKIHGEMESPVSKYLIEGALWREASNDPRFLRAWQNRGKDPDGFNRILGAVRRNIEKEMGSQPDKTVSADREAVTRAVRGASNAPPAEEFPSEKELNQMSDAEFRRMTAKMR